MICSFLIPTRGRPEKLARAVDSILATATNPEHIEILLRVDDDDDTRKSPAYEAACHHKNLFVIVGKKLAQYEHLNQMFTQLASLATGEWIAIWNDDATIEGKGWDDQLLGLPKTGFIVQPEFHQLCSTVYPNNHDGPFPIVPRDCWRRFGYNEIPDPADTQLHKILRLDNGWQTYFLKGIKFNHQREIDATLPKERY